MLLHLARTAFATLCTINVQATSDDNLCVISECIYSVGSLAVCLGWSLGQPLLRRTRLSRCIQRCPREKKFLFTEPSILLHFPLLQWVLCCWVFVFFFCCFYFCPLFPAVLRGTGWQFYGCIAALKFHPRMQSWKQCAQASHACYSLKFNREVPGHFSFPQLQLAAVPRGK